MDEENGLVKTLILKYVLEQFLNAIFLKVKIIHESGLIAEGELGKLAGEEVPVLI